MFKKRLGSGSAPKKTPIISNKEMNNIMKIVQAVEHSRVY